MSLSTIIGLVVVIVVVGGAISIYNKLVAFRNQFRNGFSQIDVQLQRRHDLIPNLVEAAKAYLSHEKETLTRVIEARNQAVGATRAAETSPDNAEAIRKLSGAEMVLGKAMAQFYAVAENYPDLKANATVQQLMEELSSTENKVSFARQAYNDAVMVYHTYREQFPNNFIAGFFGFKETSLFETQQPEAQQAPRISLS